MQGQGFYTLDVTQLRQALVSVTVLAVETAVRQGLGNVEHIGGILTGIKAVGLNFGIGWSLIINDARLALGSGYGELLDAAGAGLLTGNT